MHAGSRRRSRRGSRPASSGAADPGRIADRVLAICDGFGVRALLTELSLDRARDEVWAFLAGELGVDPRRPAE